MGCAVEEYAAAGQGECKDIRYGPPKRLKVILMDREAGYTFPPIPSHTHKEL